MCRAHFRLVSVASSWANLGAREAAYEGEIMSVVRPLFVLATALVLNIVPVRAVAQIYIGIEAPPLLPTYTQPLLTQPNYIWQPGYWAWGPAGYYWVPGTWVPAPSSGMWWTPGYWRWLSDGFEWNPGYWGPSIGYYGGVNYGYGYYGNGYVGGIWRGNVFTYNTAVTRVNTTIVRHVYVDKTVVVNHVVRTAYNGGPGGIQVHPTPAQLAASRRAPMTDVQREHVAEAQRNRNNLTTVNHGVPPHPTVASPLTKSTRPQDFKPVTNADRQAAAQVKPPVKAPPQTHEQPAGKPPK
jgi:hypothetical protein